MSSEVSELVNKAVREFKRQSGERVEVWILQEQPVYIIENPLEFELVIINLLRNAAQALQELGVLNSKVALTIKREDNKALIAIEDNGHIEK